MPTLGSSTNPSWAGWIEHGAGWIFGSLYTTPNFDLLLKDVAAYFNTYNGNGAHGWLAVFDDQNNLIWRGDKGIINNGTLSAGGQQWWHWSPNAAPNVLIPANTNIWICGYCNQSIVYSTYDTSPHAFNEPNGGTQPGSIGGMQDTGQGPCGAYITYSQVIYANPFTFGSNGGGLAKKTALVDVKSGSFSVGEPNAPGGGLAPANSTVTNASTATMGGGGGMVITSVVHVPTLRVWRAN